MSDNLSEVWSVKVGNCHVAKVQPAIQSQEASNNWTDFIGEQKYTGVFE